MDADGVGSATARSGRSDARGPWAPLGRFAVLAIVGAVPFWVLGAVGGTIPGFPSRLPWTALAACVPAVAALVLARHEGGLSGLRAQFRVPRHGWVWWFAAVTASMLPTYADALVHHGPWAPPDPLLVAGLLALYLVGALGEELGWTAFALPRLLRLTGSATTSALILGAYWMVWHLVPYLTTGNAPAWVAAQSGQALLSRCVWVGLVVGHARAAAPRLAGGTDLGPEPPTDIGAPVLPVLCAPLAVLAHALSNLAWSTSPGGGLDYDPVFVDAVLLPLAVSFLWVASRRTAGWTP